MIYILDDRIERQKSHMGNHTFPGHIRPAILPEIQDFKSISGTADDQKKQCRKLIKALKPGIFCIHSSFQFHGQQDLLPVLQDVTTTMGIPLVKFSGGISLMSTQTPGMVYHVNVNEFYKRLLHKENAEAHADPVLLLFGSRHELSELMKLRRQLTLYFQSFDTMSQNIIENLKLNPSCRAIENIAATLDPQKYQDYTHSFILPQIDEAIAGHIRNAD